VFATTSSSHLSKITIKLQNLQKYNGTLFAIKHFKACRLHCTRWLCGEPIKVSRDKISLDKEGFPNLFSDLKPLLKGTLAEQKYAMSLLQITKVIKPLKGEKLPIDLEPITKPWDGIDTITNSELDEAFKQLGIQKSITLDWTKEKVKLITKAGPNGPQTLS
jgi:hypothetical protein